MYSFFVAFIVISATPIRVIFKKCRSFVRSESMSHFGWFEPSTKYQLELAERVYTPRKDDQPKVGARSQLSGNWCLVCVWRSAGQAYVPSWRGRGRVVAKLLHN